MTLSGYDLDSNSASVHVDAGHLGGAEVAVPRLAGLQTRGEVDPQLEADIAGAIGVDMGHLGVDDAPAGRHELQVTGAEGALIAGEVFVVHAALQEVGYRLLTPMRA